MTTMSRSLSVRQAVRSAPVPPIPIAGSAPSGLALSADGGSLFVALNLKHAVAVIDTASREVTEVPVGSYPYTVVPADGRRST